MKRKILLLVMAAVAMSASAGVSIVVNTVDEDSAHMVMTSDENLRTGFTDTALFSYGLAFVAKTDTLKMLSLSLKMSSPISDISKGRKLLIRTGNGTVLTLTAAVNSKSDVWTEPISGIDQFRVMPSYGLTDADIAALQTGIVKIRMETDTDLIDREYSAKTTAKTAEKITEMLNAIKRVMQPTDVTIGF